MMKIEVVRGMPRQEELIPLSTIMADTNVSPSSFSHEKLRDFLWHDNLETRKRFLELVTSSDLWIPKWNVPLAEQREIAFKRLQAISKAKLFSVKDFLTNPRNIFTGTPRSQFEPHLLPLRPSVPFDCPSPAAH